VPRKRTQKGSKLTLGEMPVTKKTPQKLSPNHGDEPKGNNPGLAKQNRDIFKKGQKMAPPGNPKERELTSFKAKRERGKNRGGNTFGPPKKWK